MQQITDYKAKSWRYIRRGGLLPLAFILVFSFGFMMLFFDYYSKEYLEKIASQLNGAQVNIGSIHTSLIKQKVEIHNIQVAHHTKAMKNLLQIDKIECFFRLETLFRKKLIIYAVSINGIHYGTSRENSGEINNTDDTYIPLNILDRYATGVYDELRNEFSKNPLKHLSVLETGLSLKSKIESFQNELSSLNKLHEFQKKLDSSTQKWALKMAELPSTDNLFALKNSLERKKVELRNSRQISSQELTDLKHNIISKKKLIDSYAEKVKEEYEMFRVVPKLIEGSLQEDVKTIKEKLDLPDLDKEDLTADLFGAKLLGYLERVSYWIELSRRKMPTGSQLGPNSIIVNQRDSGHSVHFGRDSGNPTFLISHIMLQSEASDDTSLGQINGQVRGITTDPYVLGAPVTISIHSDFPDKGFKGFEINAQIDHVKNVPEESFKLSIQSFPIENWIITDNSEIKIGIKKAVGTLNIDGVISENKIDIQWKMHFQDVEYLTSSRFKKIEEVVRNNIASIYSFNLNGSVLGNKDNIKFTCTSELGKKLVSGLKQDFNHPLLAIDTSIHDNIIEFTAANKQRYIDRLNESHENIYSSFLNAQRSIQAIATIAEK